MWFERSGFITADGWVVQDYKKEPLDLNEINLQAVLESGPFFGSFAVDDPDPELINELRRKQFGAPLGIAFGERIVRAVINPHFVRAVTNIRLLLGQHWLEPLRPWDGKPETLGVFCQHLQMWWRVDQANFAHFLPAAPDQAIGPGFTGNPYLLIPDQARWQLVVEAIKAGYEPPLGVQALARAHELRDNGESRLAIIEGITALELLIDHTLRSKIDRTEAISKAGASLNNLAFTAKLAFVATFLGIADADIELCLRAYSLRNRVAHEGAVDAADISPAIEAVLEVGRSLTSEPRITYGLRQTANEKRKTVAEWDLIPGPKYHLAASSARSSPPGFTDWRDENAHNSDAGAT